MCSLYRLPGFVISRFFFIHIFCHYWGKGNRSFYRGLRYIKVPLQWGSKKNTNKEVSGSYHVVLMICFLSLIFNLKRFAGRIIPHLSGVIQLKAPRHNQTKLAFCTAVCSFRYHFVSSVQADTTESPHCWAKDVGNVASVLAVVCKSIQPGAPTYADVLKLRASGRNNSRQCWELLTNKQAKQKGKERKRKMTFEAIKMTLPRWKQFLYGMVINTYGVVRSLLSRCLNVRGAQDQRKEQGAREKNERGHACLSFSHSGR